MPVLPQFTPVDTLGAFDRGAQMTEGLMSRARQRAIQDQQIQQNNILLPVVQAEAQARVAEAANKLSAAQDQAQLRTHAAESRMEAADRFHRITQIDALYADPNDRERQTQVRREALTNFVMDFGSFDQDPEIGPKLKYATKELMSIQGAEEFNRQQVMRNMADEQARIAAQQARLAATEDFLSKTVPGWKGFNVPVPVEGNPNIGILYTATPDGGYTTKQIYTQPQGMAPTVEERSLAAIRRLKDSGDEQGARLLFQMLRARSQGNSLFGGADTGAEWDKAEADLFGGAGNEASGGGGVGAPAGQPAATAPVIPVAHVQYLKDHADDPQVRADFEAKYGKQASDLILGKE